MLQGFVVPLRSENSLVHTILRNTWKFPSAMRQKLVGS